MQNVTVFAISFAVLLLELLLTRVFSVVMFHHFSFLAVSLAMTGLGLGGLVVNLRPRLFRRDNVDRTVPLLALGFGASALLAIGVAFHTAVRMEDTAQNWQRVSLVLAASVVPFTLAGLMLAHILAFAGERIPRLYFFDLLGAALACFVMVPLTGWMGAPSALLATAAIGVASGAASGAASGVTAPRGIWPRVCAAVALVLVVASGINISRNFLDLRYAKGGAASPTLVTRWNSFSRVEVRGNAADLERARAPVSWGFSSRLAVRAKELHLLYDADAMTQIVGFDGDPKSVTYLLWDVTSAAHQVHRNPSVLVIGSGGGRDVLAALAAGSTNVTGVEINDVTVGLMRNEFRDYTHGLYSSYPGVTIRNEDGRSYVRRTHDRYDLIQASLVDTWAASSAGAYSLTENSLYTVEAFGDYLDKLTPDGVVSFSRWYGSPPTEVARTIALAREALRRRGVTDPRAHIVVVRTDTDKTRRPSLATVLVKRSPFTETEISSLARWAGDMLFDLTVLPPVTQLRGSEPGFDPLFASDSEYAAYAASLDYDISPSTDDCPFFFDRVPLVGWLAHRVGLPAPAWSASQLPLGSRTLLIAIVVTAINAVLLIAAPLLLRNRRTRSRENRIESGHLRWIAYFACLGVGYIAVEIVLIQRFHLFLGKPSHALSVVLFSMLSSSAVGALAAQRFEDSLPALARMLAAAIVAIAALALSTGPVVAWAGGAHEAVRIAVAAAMVAPVGFVMGMPFPTALRRVARLSPALVSWAWAVNGATSVLGSVLAVIVSMTAGFTASMALGWLSYAVALVVVLGLQRQEPVPVPSTVTSN